METPPRLALRQRRPGLRGPGAGGSFGFADPATGTGYGYVPNRMGLRIRDDPRDAALRRALADCLKASTP
ncbi:hypothetical protein [Nocardiopsis alba]|uniref:hypothetical protein n=1 Tax=Nocardiopsis alba TaxID=53437 RepID=UPI0035DC3479